MATIALYTNKINQMPGLIKDVKKSVIDYKAELSALKTKTLTINKSVCDLEDVIRSIQTSTQTQEQKSTSLDTFNNNCEDFIAEVVRIDGDVADVIRQRKDDFYKKYSYLKPECEKNGWEKFKDGCRKAAQWCKDHWKAIATVAIIIAAVIVIVAFPCAAPLLLLMAKGAILGAVIGGIAGGAISALGGNSFWEGLENGAFAGAIAGIISSGMFVMSAGTTIALSLGKTMLVGGVSGVGSSLISDLGDIFIKGENISFGQVLFNMGISGVLGAAFAGIGYGIAKGFTALKVKLFSGKPNTNSGSVEFSPPKKNATPEQIAQTKAYVKGCNEALKDGALSSTGRVSTKGALGKAASAAANAERQLAAAAGTPYKGHAGHVPDTTWTGTAQPHSWLDLHPSVNTSLGAQALRYPIGYQPTRFVFKMPGFSFFKSPVIWGIPSNPIFNGFVME